VLVDGIVVGSGEIKRFTPSRYSLTGAGLTVGRDPGLPVVDDYDSPFAFTGEVREVVIEVDGPPHLDPEAEADAAIASQ